MSASFDIGLLGPLVVRRDGGVVRIAAPKQRALVALLALEVGRPVSTDELADKLWAGRPPETAATALQVYVSQLRKQLGADAIATRPPGYALDLPAEAVDAERFERLVGDGRPLLASGDADGAAAVLGEALSLWRGPALAEFVYEEWAAAPARRLEELRLVAIEDRLDALLRLGQGSELVGELEVLVPEHPLRERLRAYQMLALYRAGRQADALAAYQDARAALVEELGIDPSPGLVELERQILTQDPALGSATPLITTSAPRTADESASLPVGTVTFLFTDVEGSTALVQRAGGEFPALLEKHRELVRDACRDGVEFGAAGDGLFFAFARAGEAISAAAAAQRAVEGYPWPDDRRIRVRIGVHTGSVELLGRDYVGVEVHRVARVCSAAHGGQVLVSDATRGLVGAAGDGLALLGTFRLKDFDQPEALYQLTADGVLDEFPPPRTDPALGNTLPREVTTLVGRDAELVAIRKLLDEHRLVTLTGAGGSGKTRLALRTAHNLAPTLGGPAAFVPMAPLGSVEELPAAVSRACGRSPVGEWDLIIEMLHIGPGLLVLDNAEHLAGLAGLVDSLIAETNELTVLVTSRTPLGVEGEQLYLVEPLPPPDAISLLVERVRQHTPSYEPDDLETGALGEIVERLAGLPLALELAAARLRALSAAGLAARLDRQLDVLATSRRGLPDRQQTMRAAIEWSYDLLSGGDQVVFERLSVFAAPAMLDAIAVVLEQDDLVVLDGLTRLIDASLIRFRGPESRYSMLEPVRQFAAERLDQRGDRDAARRRVIHWQRAKGASFSGGPPDYRWDVEASWAFYTSEAENTLRALDYAAELGDWDGGARILFDALNVLFGIGMGAVIVTWVQRALDTPALRFEDAEAEALFRMLVSSETSGYLDPNLCVSLHNAAVDVAYRSGNIALISMALRDQIVAAIFCGRLEDAERGLNLLVDVPSNEQRDSTRPLLLILAAAARGNQEAVASLREQAIRHAEQLGPSTWVVGLSYVASCYLMLGEYETGLADAEQALSAAQTHGIEGVEAQAIQTALAARLAVGADPTKTFVENLGRGFLLYPRSGEQDAFRGYVFLHYAAGWLALNGDAEHAAMISGASSSGLSKLPRDPDVHLLVPAEQHLTEARGSIGEQRWSALYTEGACLDVSEGAERALEWLDALPTDA